MDYNNKGKILVFFQRWKELKFFLNISQIFFFVKPDFMKNSCNTTLFLLVLLGFWSTFGLFHYAKLPRYKRERWGRLAGPFPSADQPNNQIQWIFPHWMAKKTKGSMFVNPWKLIYGWKRQYPCEGKIVLKAFIDR